MTEFDWKIKHKREKMLRQQQITWRLLFIAFLIVAFAFGFLSGIFTDKASGEELVVPDLWVGASQEDFSYSVEVEEEVADESAVSEFELAYPNEDLELFAKILYLEAGTQSDECVEMVGNVILNRIESDFGRFSKQHTIEDVVSSKGQYTTYKRAKKMDADDVPEWIYQIADYLLAYGSQDTKPLYQHYKRAVRGTRFYKRIGTEVFSY